MAIREVNGLKVKAKETIEHMIVDEAKIPTTTTVAIKEKKAQPEDEERANKN